MITVKVGTYSKEEKENIQGFFSALEYYICNTCRDNHPDLFKSACGTRYCPYRHLLYDVQGVQDWSEASSSRRCNNL